MKGSERISVLAKRAHCGVKRNCLARTRKRCLGMVPKLLTDARETSYGICSSLLTAECSTFELPELIHFVIVAMRFQAAAWRFLELEFNRATNFRRAERKECIWFIRNGWGVINVWNSRENY